jgi:predicted DNA-binding transcriptional regulator AlpA
MIDKLLTVKDVRLACAVSDSTIYRWRKSGLFPESVGIGKLLWTEKQILDWQNRKESTQSNLTLPNVGSVQQKRESRAFEERQKLAKNRLAAHAQHRKQK